MHECINESSLEADRDHLRVWMKLSTAEKVDFFEEMVELAYQSGALAPERLELRDQPTKLLARE